MSGADNVNRRASAPESGGRSFTPLPESGGRSLTPQPDSGADSRAASRPGSRAGSKRQSEAYERPASSQGLGSAAATLSEALEKLPQEGSARKITIPVRQDDAEELDALEDEFMQTFPPILPGTADAEQRLQEREIEVAELETRIRRFNLEIVQPTIRKTAFQEMEVAALRSEVERNSTMITDLANVAHKVEEQVATVESFKEQMSKWEAERRAVQAHVAEVMSSMRQDMDNFRYSLERKDASIHSMQRTMDRLVGELSKVQEGSEALRQHVELRLGQTGKILNGAKTDLECKIIALETKQNRLSDELWGEETGLARATTQIAKTNDLVTQLSEEMKRMQHDKANMTQLESVQDDVNELIRDANCNVTMLKQTVDTMVSDVKRHFQTATNTVAAHNATMLSEVRGSYQEEMRKSDALRSEVMQFMQDTKENVARIDDTVVTSKNMTSDMVKKVSEEVTELNRSRKQDNADLGLRGQTMKEQISKVSSTSENVASRLEHLGNIITVLLKSERVASALSIQENSDRQKVALMGYRDSKTIASRPASKSAKKTRTGPRQQPQGDGEEQGSGEAVISVDNRCLSCSGQAQHVLSGFKMACLEYAPGPVSWDKQLYKREELLDLRQRFLEQAQEQLQQGPAGNLSDFTASNNRSWKQELEASLKQRTTNQDESERPDSQSSHGSFMKPRALPPLSPGLSSLTTAFEDSSRPMTAR